MLRYFITISILVLSLVLNTSFAADKDFDSVVVDEVTSIYDGDTFRVNVKAWPDIIGHRVPVRVNGIDTPEIRGKCQYEKDLARKAKQFTVRLLRNAKIIELQNINRGKYFRVLADVSVDGRDFGESLVSNGLAVRYGGGIKIDWCR